MQDRWLVPLVPLVLACLAAACAKGSSFDGDTGGQGGASTTSSTTSSSSTASSSSSSSAGGGTSSSSTGGGGGGSSCSEMPCKLVPPQCGCEAGKACSIGANGRFCTTAGTTKAGEQCTIAAKCEPGTLCVQTSAKVSTCSLFCDSDAMCNAPGGLCVITLSDGMGGELPNATLCSENCDPITSTGCPVAGTSCQIGQEPMGLMRNFTLCLGAGAGGQGAACTDSNQCSPGYGCFTVDVTECLKFCNVNNPVCPPATTCSSFQTPILIGGTEYGACL